MSLAAEVMKVSLLAGEIMLKYGAETYRVEETMARMAQSQKMKNVHCFVTPTGIFLSFISPDKVGERTRMVRIAERYIDLNKVTLVNDLSRRFVEGKLSLGDAERELRQIDQRKSQYPMILQHLASGVAGGSFAILFGGASPDFLPAFIAGMGVNIALVFFQYLLRVKFFAEMAAAFCGGIISIILFHFLGLGLHMDQIIVASLMPLVPGVPITNAVRDILVGDLVAGVARGVEALLTALSIALGIALTLYLFSALSAYL